VLALSDGGTRATRQERVNIVGPVRARHVPPQFVRCGGRCDRAPPRNPVAVSPLSGGNSPRSETSLCR